MLNDQIFVIISQNNGISYATEFFVDFNKQTIFKKSNINVVGVNVDEVEMTENIAIFKSRGLIKIYYHSLYSSNNNHMSEANTYLLNGGDILLDSKIITK